MNTWPNMRNQDGLSDHEHVAKISTPTTIVVLLIIGLALYVLRWVILPFLISGIVAYLCTPVVNWLAGRTHLPRAFWAVVAFVLLLGIVGAGAWWGGTSLSYEFIGLATDLQGSVESAARSAIGDRSIDVFGQTMDAQQIAQAIVAGVRWVMEQPGTLAMIGGTVFAGLFGLPMTLTLLIYFLLTGPQIVRGMLWLVPPKQRPFIQHITSKLDPIIKRYFAGVLVVVMYASVAAYIGLGVVLGLKHAVLLALLTGFLEMIPVIGPATSSILAGVFALGNATGIGSIIGYAVYATVLRLSIDQFVGPLALGAAGRVSPVLVMFCFVSGAVTFGIAGVILAVPVALITRATLAILYDEPPPSARSDR
jgi:predicted PurR-regulated permease PerM